ncbi:MAG: hypothetical protein M0Z31_15630 [Clostridia bacterium]|nr:hypothetical protein [Clostridia bacterium]
MSYIIGAIYATKYIGTRKMAQRFFEILKEANMEPDKIGLYEPVKKLYTIEKAIDMWVFGDEPGPEAAGGMLGVRKQPPNYTFDIGWARGPLAVPNDVTFFFSPKVFAKHRNIIEHIFKETYHLFDGFYGYITHNRPESRQHVTGSIKTRIPGLFWCNYFSPLYVDFFGREKILSGPWVKTEELDSGTIVTYLAGEPDKEILESDFFEKRAKEHLGIESFGDPEEGEKNPDEIQIRKVPAIVIPEVRGE